MNIRLYTQLYFVESIRKKFIVTDGTDSYCNGGLHSLYKPQWFKICFLDFIMIKKCCGNDVAAFAKLSHVTLYARTATGGKYVGGGEKFLCRSHILALIFVDL